MPNVILSKFLNAGIVLGAYHKNAHLGTTLLQVFMSRTTNIMSLKKAAVVSALLALTSFSVSAQDSAKAPGSGPNPFSDCGIGAALFSETKWAAVTSNVIWDVGTTAVTSATASPQTCNGKQMAAATLINDTYEKLVEETARGQGEHLTSLLNIFECGDARQGRAIDAARGAMGELVAQPGYATQDRTQKAARFYEVVDSAVSKSCSA